MQPPLPDRHDEKTCPGRTGPTGRSAGWSGALGAEYSGGMGRMILKILGAILAVWVVFMAIGWMLAMVKTFVIIGLIAVVVFIVVSLLAKRSRRS
jgi:hypothetical protein